MYVRTNLDGIDHYFDPVKNALHAVARSISSAAGKTYSVAVNIIFVIAKVKNDPNCLARVLKLGIYSLQIVEAATKRTYLSAFGRMIGNADNLIDTAQIFADFSYFLNGEFVEDIKKWASKACSRKSKIFAQIGFSIADSMGLAMWLDELGFIKLANVGAKMTSKLPALEVAAKFGFGNICRSAVGVSFAFFGYYAIKKIVVINRDIRHLEKKLNKLSSSEEKASLDATKISATERLIARAKIARKANGIELAWAGTETTFKVIAIGLSFFTLTGTALIAGEIALAGLGIAAALIGIIATVYKIVHRNDLDDLISQLPVEK